MNNKAMGIDLHHCFRILFLLLITSVIAEASKLCRGAPTKCTCFPNGQNSIELRCREKTGIGAKVSYSVNDTSIECSNSEFDLNMFDLEMNELNSLALKNCNANFSRFDKFFSKLRENTNLTMLIINETPMDNDDLDVLYGYINGTSAEIIRLVDDNLGEFPEILNNFPYLLELNLNDNLIGELPESFNFPELIALFLENNAINYLDSNIFENATELRLINLSENRITNFPENLLHPVPKLKVFLSNSNKIKAIPDGFFEKNTLLEEVRLSNTSLTEIRNDTFSKSSQLKILRLDNNMLRVLPPGIFANLTKLKNLGIGNNFLEELSQNIFKDLRNLTFLSLVNNQLSKWPNENNEYLKSLNELLLNYNKLSRIEEKTFSGLQQLKILNLKHNEISEIEVTALNNLRNLNTLNLSFNKLTEIDGVVAMLMMMERRTKFFLNNNLISIIKVPKTKAYASQFPKNLYFSENPFECGCENYEFIRLFQTSIQAGKFRASGTEVCATPLQRKGVKLRNVNLRDFTCFDGCPSGCICQFDLQTNSLWLNCSNSNLTKIPPIPHMIQWHSQTKINVIPANVQVNLENNHIQEFRKDFSYGNVTVLNLAKNKLTRIDWIPPRIQVLNLSHNMFTNFDSNMISLLNVSTGFNLTLNNNPWSCDCETMELVNVIRSNLVKIVSNNTITCADGFSLLELHEEKACANISSVLVILIVISSLVVLIAVILLILYFRYENYVKIWLYNHKLLTSLIKEDDIDRDMEYDAFISYSHKDQEFVEKCLAPELENGPEKYKLCLHERDWIVGEYIPKQIMDSVRNSRRSILVLSKNFLGSYWATMEFKTAHNKSMEEERARLIIILYEDIDINDINCKELRDYLTTNTYIKWGDPWFWKKLRNSMPSNRKNRHRKTELDRIDNPEKIVNT